MPTAARSARALAVLRPLPRFTGTFSDDGDTIGGTWEKSFDGSNWEHDFNLTYRRVM
jgi:hypothetical protein